MVGMRPWSLAGAVLAFVLGACPCLAPLASASAETPKAHACCPAPAEDGAPASEASGDCCLRAPASSAAQVEAPLPVLIAVAAVEAVPAAASAVLPLAASLAAPPGPLPGVPSGLSPPVRS